MKRTATKDQAEKLAGDVLSYNVGSPGGDEAIAQAEETIGGASWRRGPAVEDGEAQKVDPDHWFIFGGLRSTNLVLGDVEEYPT